MEFCPVCNKKMELTTMDKSVIFRKVKIIVKDQAYICPNCGLEVGTTEQTGKLQKLISEAYKKNTGLLTGAEIRKNRKRLGLTQRELADIISVGVSSINRWEGGVIQSKSMDKLLRSAFKTIGSEDLVVCDDMFNRKPVFNPRHGWDKAFKKMAQKKDDELIWDD